MSKKTTEDTTKPKTTPVPNVFFDVLLSDLTGTEAKVLFYIIRRTCGFSKLEDTISLKQFRLGIRTREGVQRDKGCGIEHNRTIIVALRSLEAKGYISSQKRKTTLGDDDVTLYRLHLPEEQASQESNEGVAPDNKGMTTSNNGRYSESQPVVTSSNEGVVTSSNPQKIVLQKTVIQKTVKQKTSNNDENVIEPPASADATAASQESSSCSDEKQSSSEEEEKDDKPPRTRKTLKSKLIALEDFNFEQENTIENIMALGDTWRGGALPAVKRADSDYQKALLQGATPLSQRQRQDGKKGFSLREIDSAYRFFKRVAPKDKPWLIADEWWVGKPIDLWVINKNIDKALVEMKKLEEQYGQASLPPTPEVPSQPHVQPASEQVLWTRTPDDMEHIAVFVKTRRAEVDKWEALRDKIHWEYIPEQEARSHGWTAGKVFSDRERRELFAAKARLERQAVLV
jgi:hypothetical protein